MLEAGIRSGSLNTAGHAASLGRPLGAVPGPVTSPASAGCHRLLREFAAVCVVDADQMAELVGVSRVVSGADAIGSELSPDVSRVMDALSTRSPRAIDDLARRTGMSVHEVMAVLGVLELSGAVVRHPDGWTRPRSSRQARDGGSGAAAAP